MRKKKTSLMRKTTVRIEVLVFSWKRARLGKHSLHSKAKEAPECRAPDINF